MLSISLASNRQNDDEFLFIGGIPVNFTVAEAICESQGGRLARVTNRQDYNRVVKVRNLTHEKF